MGRIPKAMEKTLGSNVSKRDLLRYCLAFLNSSYAQDRLITGHRPTPKGSYTITEEYLKEIPIPAPTNKSTVKAIIGLVEKLEDPESALKDLKDRQALENKLETRIQELLN